MELPRTNLKSIQYRFPGGNLIKSQMGTTGQTFKLCLKEYSILVSVLHSGLLGSYARMTWYRRLSLSVL